MFMEILYKQTALFPLSSCRYEAAVTFFIDRLKHLTELPPAPAAGLLPQPTHASHRGIPTSKEPNACFSARPGLPSPWPSLQSKNPDSRFFPLPVILLGPREEEGEERGISWLPLPTPTWVHCLLRARRCSRL